MGIIGDAFGKLFGVIWDVVVWIAEFFKGLLQTVLDIIVGFFQVIFDLIAGLLYLIYMISVLAVKLFLVIFEAGKLLISFVIGFGRTLAGLSYTAQGGSGNGYADTIGKLFNALEPLQLAPIAYILLFILWFITAVSAMKILGSMKNQ